MLLCTAYAATLQLLIEGGTTLGRSTQIVTKHSVKHVNVEASRVPVLRLTPEYLGI